MLKGTGEWQPEIKKKKRQRQANTMGEIGLMVQSICEPGQVHHNENSPGFLFLPFVEIYF